MGRLAWALVLTGISAACGPKPPRTISQEGFRLRDPVPCIPELPGAHYRCSALVVPERRDSTGRPVGNRAVTLQVVTFPATKEPRQPDPIFYLSGGGTSAFRRLLSVASYMAEGSDRDFVVMERRGAGYSDPSLACGDPTALTSAAVRSCADSLDRAGVDLADYGAGQATRDYLDLADAVGIPQFDLYAQSAGAWPFVFGAAHPDRVRALVIDGPEPPNVGPADPAGALVMALSLLFAQCAKDPACSRNHPDPRADFRAAVDALDRTPASYGGRSIGPRELVDMVAAAATDQAKLGGIPAGLAAARVGNWSLAGRLLQEGADLPEGVDLRRMVSAGLYLMERCSEASPPRVAAVESWAAAVAEAGRARAAADAALCAAWPNGGAKAASEGPKPIGAPTLLVVGANDPVTPPAWATVALRGLLHGSLVTIPSAAHGTLGLSCPRLVMRRFLERPSAPPDTACVASTYRIQFHAE